jgi:hypothetical protein
MFCREDAMRPCSRIAMGALFCFGGALGWESAYGQTAAAQKPAVCARFHIDDAGSKSLQPWTQPADRGCKVRTLANGLQLPDPKCTPGAFNPTVTVQILGAPGFTTKCLRDDVTTEEQKAATYDWYGIPQPTHNDGPSQTCELDHLVSLELGGADTLDNIWPQCGPAGVALDDRFFKRKDKVEDYLAEMVRAGKMDIAVAQRGIASDWTKFLDQADAACKSGTCEVK